jgi:hypothetical protein
MPSKNRKWPDTHPDYHLPYDACMAAEPEHWGPTVKVGGQALNVLVGASVTEDRKSLQFGMELAKQLPDRDTPFTVTLVLVSCVRTR